MIFNLHCTSMYQLKNISYAHTKRYGVRKLKANRNMYNKHMFVHILIKYEKPLIHIKSKKN